MKKYILYIIFAFSGLHHVCGQDELIQWTGVIRNDLLEPVQFAHIVLKRDYRGTISDSDGRFTIITFPKDTLLISCIGYKALKIPVPDKLNSKHYMQDIILETDTIMLSEVVILPWRTYKEFKDAFLALDLPEDDMQRAYRNIAAMQEQIHNIIANRPATPNTNFRDVMASNHNRMMTYGHVLPTYAITNPFAWARFFQAVKNGEFKKKQLQEQKPSVLDEYTNDSVE